MCHVCYPPKASDSSARPYNDLMNIASKTRRIPISNRFVHLPRSTSLPRSRSSLSILFSSFLKRSFDGSSVVPAIVELWQGHSLSVNLNNTPFLANPDPRLPIHYSRFHPHSLLCSPPTLYSTRSLHWGLSLIGSPPNTRASHHLDEGRAFIKWCCFTTGK